jgi:hypothetical protein
MSPDKKLDWFRTHGYTPEEVDEVRALTKARYTTDYALHASVLAPCSPSSSSSLLGSVLSPVGSANSVSAVVLH